MPSPIDNSCLHYLSAKLYDPGEGDPYLTDRGFNWYDIVAETHGQGTSTRTADGDYHLHYLEGVGITCRPFFVLSDTRKVNWVSQGGTWEERRPLTGSPRKYRMHQIDASPNLRWATTSDFTLPPNPNVFFTFRFFDAPGDNDDTLYPPYTRLELGSGTKRWGLEFSKSKGSRLVYLVDGIWEPVMEIDEPTPIANVDFGELIIGIRWARGKLLISTDGVGAAWQDFSWPDGTPPLIPAGKVTVRGQSQSIMFGMHRMQFFEGTYVSPRVATYTSRTITTTPLISGIYRIPSGASLTFADNSVPVNALAGYSATLTPETLTGTFPFPFQDAPELYAVKYKIETQSTGGGGDFTTPFDNKFLGSIRIDKNVELDVSTLDCTVRKEHTDQFIDEYGKFPKIQFTYWTEDEEGNLSAPQIIFTGYVTSVVPHQGEYGKSQFDLKIENPTHLFKCADWDDFTAPLSGQTVNEALDEILDSIGYTAAHRNWHTDGDLFFLDIPLPEDPPYWPKANEKKWDTMVAIAERAGLVLTVTDEGVLTSLPRNYVYPVVARTYKAETLETDELKQLVHDASLEFDSQSSYTGVVVRAKDKFDRKIFVFGIDTVAENDPSSPRFSPIRMLHQRDLEGAMTFDMALQHALADYWDFTDPLYMGSLTTPLHLDISRRQRIVIEGLKIGITDDQEFAALGISHHIPAEPTDATGDTSLTIRRLNALPE